MSTEKTQYQPYGEEEVFKSTRKLTFLERANFSETVENNKWWIEPILWTFPFFLFENLATRGFAYIVRNHHPIRDWCRENVWLHEIAYWGWYFCWIGYYARYPFNVMSGVAFMLFQIYTKVYYSDIVLIRDYIYLNFGD